MNMLYRYLPNLELQWFNELKWELLVDHTLPFWRFLDSVSAAVVLAGLNTKMIFDISHIGLLTFNYSVVEYLQMTFGT